MKDYKKLIQRKEEIISVGLYPYAPKPEPKLLRQDTLFLAGLQRLRDQQDYDALFTDGHSL